jgi:toxin FitB
VSAPVVYLVDTNVVSETRKKKADAGVISFLRGADSSSLYLSVLTVGELRKGVAAKRRQDPAAGKSLAAWVEGLEAGFTDRILGIDVAIARLWGEWSSDRPRPVIDTLLAATASIHNLTLVTRNVDHVRGLPVRTLNPWST